MKHYNPSLSEASKKLFASKAGDMLPNFVDDKITPTVELRLPVQLLGSNTLTTTGTIGATAVVTGRDQIITGICVGFVKNAACDVASGSLIVQATIGGAIRNLIQIPVLTLTAERDLVYVDFDDLKIDTGSQINLTGTFTAGSMVRSISVYGYFAETATGI